MSVLNEMDHVNRGEHSCRLCNVRMRGVAPNFMDGLVYVCPRCYPSTPEAAEAVQRSLEAEAEKRYGNLLAVPTRGTPTLTRGTPARGTF
jgi:hypothetical protein